MEIAEILHQFERANGKFPAAAVEAAVERREEIIPELLRILEDTADRAKELSSDGEYMAHLFAMYLLAQFRETRAYPLVVRIASLPSKIADSLLDDLMTDGLDRVLASVCDGDLAGIKSVVENRKANKWARSGALDSLVKMVLAGKLGREEAIAYLAQLFRGRLERDGDGIWEQLVTAAGELRAEELMDDIERAYEQELVDPGYINLEEVEIEMAGSRTSTLTPYLVENVIDELGKWSCFQEAEQPKPVEKPRLSWAAPTPSKAEQLARLAFSEAGTLIKKSEPKIGRNEPCPCGSGKKYKKCCGG